MDQDYTEMLNRLAAQIFGREPKWRYWEDERGWMYGWTTEKMGDGKYAAILFKPVGKGSRSGRRKVERWQKVREVHFVKRSGAKARAAKWFNTRNKKEER